MIIKIINFIKYMLYCFRKYINRNPNSYDNNPREKWVRDESCDGSCVESSHEENCDELISSRLYVSKPRDIIQPVTLDDDNSFTFEVSSRNIYQCKRDGQNTRTNRVAVDYEVRKHPSNPDDIEKISIDGNIVTVKVTNEVVGRLKSNTHIQKVRVILHNEYAGDESVTFNVSRVVKVPSHEETCDELLREVLETSLQNNRMYEVNENNQFTFTVNAQNVYQCKQDNQNTRENTVNVDYTVTVGNDSSHTAFTNIDINGNTVTMTIDPEHTILGAGGQYPITIQTTGGKRIRRIIKVNKKAETETFNTTGFFAFDPIGGNDVNKIGVAFSLPDNVVKKYSGQQVKLQLDIRTKNNTIEVGEYFYDDYNVNDAGPGERDGMYYAKLPLEYTRDVLITLEPDTRTYRFEFDLSSVRNGVTVDKSSVTNAIIIQNDIDDLRPDNDPRLTQFNLSANDVIISGTTTFNDGNKLIINHGNEINHL